MFNALWLREMPTIAVVGTCQNQSTQMYLPIIYRENLRVCLESSAWSERFPLVRCASQRCEGGPNRVMLFETGTC